jgi:hypothetical protein
LLLVAEVQVEVLAEAMVEAIVEAMVEVQAEFIEEVQVEAMAIAEDIMGVESAFILQLTGDPVYIMGIGDGLFTILQTIITIHLRIIIQFPHQVIPLHPLEMSLSPRLREAGSSSIPATARARSNRSTTGRSARLGS